MGSVGSTSSSKADSLQLQEAIFYAKTRGAGSVEYTDSKGNVIKQKVRDTGGTYRTSFNPKVETYAKMSEKELNAELKKQQAISDENYMKFSRSAASKSASQVQAFTNADIELKAIKQALRRLKKR